jgi:hypothetical protein
MSASQPDRRNRPAPTISRDRRRKPRPRIDLGRTAIERLEDRTLLSNDVWIGGDGNNNWSNPGNWSQGVPGTSTTVEFQNGTTTATVNASFTIGALQIDSSWGGTLNVSNPLAVSGDLTLASGTLSLGAAMSIGGSASEWDGGGLALNGQTLTNNGTFTIAPGSGGLTLSGGGTLANAGTIDQAGTGNLALANGTLINNQSTGTYDFQADTSIVVGFDNGSFTNAGILEKTVTTGTSQITTGFSNSNAITVQTGTISLANSGTSTGGVFTVAQGATLNLTGGANVDYEGTYTGSGAGTVALASGTLTLAGNTTFNFSAGLFQWTGGVLNVNGQTLTNDGVITLSNTSATGAVTLEGGGTLANAGTIDQAGTGNLALANGTTIKNESGATYDFQADSSIAVGFDNGTFTNAGTLEKTLATGVTQDTGTSSISTGFSNSNAITVQTGTISLANSGTSTGGVFTVAQGAILNLTGGANVDYEGTYTGSGAGTIALASGTLTLAGNATFNFPAGLFQWTGGVLNINGQTLTNPSTGLITLANAATVTLEGGGTLANAGNINQAGAGNLALANGTVIDNQSAGTYDFQADSNIAVGFDNGTFTNAGTLEKTVTTGTSQITTGFSNSNAITVQTGTISLANSGTSTGGVFTVAQGATLNLTGGANVDYEGTYTGSGAGTIALASGTLTLAGNATFNFPTGLFQWTGGLLNINGQTLTNQGVITISNGTLEGGGTLANAGTIDQAGAGNLALANGTTIDNQSTGTYDFQTDSSIIVGFDNGTFTNAGTLEKTGNTGTSSITTGFNDSGTVKALSGTLSIPNASLVSSGTLGAGTWVVGTSSTLTISGVSSIATISVPVTLQGSGSIFTGLSNLATIGTAGALSLLNGATLTTAGNMVNDGNVDLAAGTLNITGTYTQASTGAYSVAIGGITPGSTYGQLNVTKSASLNGTLNVSLSDGYTPPQGDSYAILTFASETGNFSAEFGLYFGNGEGFTPTFSPSTNSTALDLVVVAEAGTTQTTVKSSENPSNYGDSVTFTATVTPTVSTSLVPQGQVTFYDGSTAIDTATLVNGSASYSTSLLTGGPHSIVAQYTDTVDSNFSGSNSTPALSQTVDPIASQTGLQSSENPSIDGDSVTFMATVSSSSSTPGIATPTGKVEFYDGSTLLDTETLSGGTASYTTSALAIGANQNIEAEYLGDNNYDPSNLTIQQTVNAPPPATLNGEVYNDPGDTGTPATGAGLSGWTVDLMSGSTQYATTTTDSSGDYSFTNVFPASYTIVVPELTGYAATVPATGTIPVSAGRGQTIDNLDFGEFQTVSMSGEVFDDVSDSGSFNASDPGLSGWTVDLLNGSGGVAQTTTTDSDGDYRFTDVGPGTYTISEVLQPGFVQSEPSSGGLSIAPTGGVDLSGEDIGIVQGALLSVTNLAITPASGLQSGTSLVVSWDDANTGNTPVAASFIDHVTITDVSTGQVLAEADVSYDVDTRGTLGAGALAAQQYAFTLPNGDAGVGEIQFTVTADDYDAVSGGLSASDRTSSISATSTLANYADLSPSNIGAPTTATPGQTVTVSWTESNLGDGPAVAPWADVILLSYDGTIADAVPVASIAVNSSIPADQSATEQASVTIPISGPVSGGSFQFVIEDNASQSFFEMDTSNNTAIDATATSIPLELTLTSPVSSIDEDASNPTILGTVSRNGPTTQSLTVTLTSSDTSQFTVPATVTIPAGQSTASVPISVLDDGIDDPDQADTITASASGFIDGPVSITDINTDQATLSVSFATSPATVAKGNFITATVTRTGSDTQAATVSLSTNSPDKIYVPAAITIPAGSASTTFNVQAIDDDIIEGTQTYAFTASAAGLVAAVGDVTVTDTDVPTLSLGLALTTVSESAGGMATTATLTRTPAGDLPIVVDLSVPAGSPVTVPASVTIPANQASVTFSVGVFDNDSAQTIQAVPITAEVTTMTDGAPLTQGSTSATLDVVSSSGPLLSVTFANPVVTQGESSATTGTVTIENASAPTSPVTVTLTSSDTAEATVPTTVTILAGSTSATFTIATPADTEAPGTVEPTITATASAYAEGTDRLIVTGTNLPDLAISSLTVPDSALNDQLFSVSYSVTNQGTAAAVGPWEDTVFITDQPTGGVLTPLGTFAFNGTMQPGQTYERSATYFAPDQTGSYWIVVQTNSGLTLDEALLTNDSAVSPQAMQVQPSYTATVQAGVSVAAAGTPIPLSGTATLAGGGPAEDDLVNIFIFTDGTQRIISALTNDEGDFSTTFQLLPGEAGVYTIGAANPGVSQATVQGGFDIIGMSVQPTTASLSLVEDSTPVGGQVTLTNLTPIALSDLQATVVGAPSNLDVTVTLGNGTPDQSLAGSGTLTLAYEATASSLLTPSGSFTIDVTSADGASVEIPVSFTVEALEPDVVASPSDLQAGMVIGDQSIVQLTLTNQGGAASGALQVILPAQAAGSAFLALGSAASIASLAPGASTQVTLLLTPPAGLPIGTYTGTIIVQGSSGSTTIPFTILNQSSATGGLDITTVDEYTYYAQGSPNLAGASISVISSLTGQVVETGVTSSDGTLDIASLPEGYYEINATASGHTPYDGTVLVSAGQTSDVTAFLSLQLVQTSFSVSPTSVQDNIQVQVNTTFEANVPAPVITASPMVFDVGPLTALGDTEQVNLTLSNNGLVAALNMELNFGTHPYYSITPLISDIGTLAADSSITIPVILKRISVTDTGNIPCSISASVSWQLLAGTNLIDYSFPLAVINVQGDCAPGKGTLGGLLATSTGGPAYSGPITPGGPGNPSYSNEVVYLPVAVSSSSDCDACETATTAALLQFSPFPDWESAGAGLGASLAGGATDVVADATGFIASLAAFLQANPDVTSAVSLIDTAQAAVQACLDSSGDSGTASVTAARDQLEAFANGFQSLVNETDDIFGSSDWINGFSGPDLTNWLTAFSADVSADAGQAITSIQAAALEAMTPPEEVSSSDVANFLARWNQTIAHNAQGVYDSTQVPSGGTTNFIPRDVWASDLQATDAAYAQVTAIGSTSFSSAILYEMSQLNTAATVTTPSTTVCALVQLQLDQEVVVARSAFNATLQIQNDKTTPISDVGLTITVRDAQGDDVTDLFDITSPDLTGLTAVDGTGTIAADTTGQAIFTLIPTNAAAPETATFYYVSAVLTYQVDGMNLAIPFAAQTITVEPNPSLTIRYFEQSAVYGPTSTDPSAPSQPFALGVQIVNSGAGTADDVSITSAQPQIVSNASGLLANFQVIATEVDGQSLSPSLTAEFGDIDPGAVAEGIFLMTSSVAGQFVSYNASFEDLSGLGTPDLSIVNSVEIYNMIHLASEIGTGASSGTAFLVSDIPGASSPPDAIYLPDGSVQPVAQAANSSIQGTLGGGTLQVTLTDTATSGWSYLDIPDPGNGQYQLIGVTRSDGTELPVNDFWQTDETYVSDGQPPVGENMLHILDDDGTGSYTLNYVPINQTQPMVTSISAVSPNPTTTAVDSLQVTFNEPIALGTFDSSALSLTLDDGPNLITSGSGVTISLVSGSTYQISGLSGLDAADGVYILSVDAAGIQDDSGNPGSGTSATSWVMAQAAPAVSTIGGVSPGSRNTPVDSVSVSFTQPIDTGSFGLSALSLTEDGGPNLISSDPDISITQEGPATFQISGLSSLTTTDGDYVLTVNASQVTSDGISGVGSGSVSWTMDTTPPLVQSFSTIASPLNSPVDSIDVTFSKPIDPTSFTTTALSMTLDGRPNVITSAVTIALVSGSTYQISGLAALDAAKGTYTLTVNGTDVSDLAGNAGANSLSTSWVEDTSLPAAPSDLAIAPNTGISTGLTDTGAVTLTGTLGATGLTVDVFDATTDTDLGAAAVNGLSFSLALDLPAGATELEVTAEDAAGNTSPAAIFNVFVDETSPTVSSFALVPANPTNTAVGTVDVSFSEAIDAATFTTADLSLTDNGGANLITSAVTIGLMSGDSYAIGGLAGLTSAEGTYVLTVNAAGIQDQAGNAGTGSLSASWLMDTTPPTSSVNALPATTTSTGVLVSVSGTDPSGANGSTPSGIATFTLFVSKDGGAFTPFATVTPADPSALFTGQVSNTYGFYSIATDNAGNVQPTPTASQATIHIVSPLSLISITPVSSPTNKAVATIDVTFSEPINTGSLTSGALTLTDDGGLNLINGGVSLTFVSGDTYAIGGLSGLTAAQGEYTLTVNAADIQDQNGIAGTGVLSTSWLMDTTAPSSHVVNALGTSQTSDTFPVQVTFTDPAGPGGAPASGVSKVSLYYSVNNGPFTLYQTMTLTTPETSGTVTFSFVGQDRNIYAFHSIAEDAAGNLESQSSNAIEASTSVPDLHPPVTQVLSSSAYNNNGVFTINWSGTDPDQDTGTPAGSIVTVDIYVVIDGSSTPTLIGQLNAGTPNGSGVYSGSMTYNALGDGQAHTYGFFSIGIDDEQKVQAQPATPNVTFSDITYSPPSLLVENLVVEKGIAERSFIQYLDVDFNETVSSSSALAALASGLSGGSASSYVQLLWYGEGLNSNSPSAGSINLFGNGTKATVSLTGNDLSINFGPGGITSLLTEYHASGTGSPTSAFGDGWYALGINPSGGASSGPVFFETFFRLLGDTNGDGTVTGPYSTAGTDAYAVYHAEGETGTLLNADVNGDGAVNSKDLTETVQADNHAVGATPPQQDNFPLFQLFAGGTAAAGHVVAITQAEVKALLPAAIDAWQAAGLDAADVRKLEGVPVGVANLGTSTLGLEANGAITINQTAAGYNWYVNASPGSSQAFGRTGPGGESVAGLGSPAADDVDLLTVLEHELGHVLGLADNAEAGDLMDVTLGLGVRRSPSAADLTAVSGATVDAALASIVRAAVGNDEDQGSNVKPGAPDASVLPVPGHGVTSRRSDRNPVLSRPYSHLNPVVRIAGKLRSIGQSRPAGLADHDRENHAG